VILLPAYAIYVIVELTSGTRLQQWLAEATMAARQGLPAPEPPPRVVDDIAVNAAAVVLMVVASLVGTAAVVAIVDAAYRGQFVSATSAVKEALRRLPALITGQLLFGVGALVIVALAMAVVAGLFLAGGLLTFVGVIVLVGGLALILFYAVRASLLTVAVIAEHVGGAAGLSRSWRLVSANGWRVLGYLVLAWLLATAVGYLFTSVVLTVFPFATGSIADAVARTVIGLIPGIVSAPLAPILLTLIYFDLRARHGESAPPPGGQPTEKKPKRASCRK
jgi:hypothetical protein